MTEKKSMLKCLYYLYFFQRNERKKLLNARVKKCDDECCSIDCYCGCYFYLFAVKVE